MSAFGGKVIHIKDSPVKLALLRNPGFEVSRRVSQTIPEARSYASGTYCRKRHRRGTGARTTRRDGRGWVLWGDRPLLKLEEPPSGREWDRSTRRQADALGWGAFCARPCWDTFVRRSPPSMRPAVASLSRTRGSGIALQVRPSRQSMKARPAAIMKAGALHQTGMLNPDTEICKPVKSRSK